MSAQFEQRLSRLIGPDQGRVLQGGKVGLEKETLRVGADGKIAQSPHPHALGSPLTHPYITTDYSEALTEFISPPCDDLCTALEFLCDTQRFVYPRLQDELLWATSMPCVVAGETSIPIAEYGSSNAGMMKTVYRRGLGYRYGRVMQVIAGVHYNYSLPEEFWPVFQQQEKNESTSRNFVTDYYFALIRNLQRFGWLIPYLFGASPTVCKSFLGDQSTTLDEFDPFTYYEPYATSLRMGDIGYQNNKENETGIKVNYDNLENYLRCLSWAIHTPCPGYEKIGIRDGDEYRQLNANILQIENEYYSTIRPKQAPIGNEPPIEALRRRGVSYVELRSLDVNAFDPLGINETQLHFLEPFLIYCLLEDSPLLSAQEQREIDANELIAAHRGREPGVKLLRNGKEYELRDWALEICEKVRGVSELLDIGDEDARFTRAVDDQLQAVRDPELTPSARMLREMRENKESFFQFALRMSEKHEKFFKQTPLKAEREKYFTLISEESWRRLRELEANDKQTFEEYVAAYFTQTELSNEEIASVVKPVG